VTSAMTQAAFESRLVLHHAAVSFHTWKQAAGIKQRPKKTSVLKARVTLWNSWTERRVVPCLCSGQRRLHMNIRGPFIF
jgi:hypothetical protein